MWNADVNADASADLNPNVNPILSAQTPGWQMAGGEQFFNIMSHGTQDFWALGLRTAAAAASGFTLAAREVLESRDPQLAASLVTSFGDSIVEQTLAYVIRAKEIISSTKNGISTIDI